MGQTWTSMRESFQTDLPPPLRPQRPPIAGNEGLQALLRAEFIDEYRMKVQCSPLNSKARLGQDYLPKPHSIDRQVPPADLNQPWPSGQVIWMDETADNGFPHTRPPYYICIPHNFDEKQFPTTLLHERVHVSQRLYRKVWETLISDVWSMKPWMGSLPEAVKRRQRINPDLIFAPLFIWKDEWVVTCEFKSESNPKLNETDLVWWNPTTKVLSRQPPPGWTDFFGNNPSGEHPFEIAAYLIAADAKGNKAYDALKPRLKDLPSAVNI